MRFVRQGGVPAAVPLREYVTLGGLPLIQVEASGTISYVHADHLGTPQKMSDGTGALTWDAVYRPFGEAESIWGPGANDQRFPGQFADAESGLHYNYFRDYDPALGRYIESDPIGLRGGPNTFAYVFGNPANLIDPYGKQALQGVAPAFGVDVATPDPSDAAWPKWVAWGLILGGAWLCDVLLTEEATKQCPPCQLIDGTIVEIGQIAYRFDELPDNVKQHGIYGSHLNLYKANQNPNNCQCFWQGINTVKPPPAPDWIPIQPFKV